MNRILIALFVLAPALLFGANVDRSELIATNNHLLGGINSKAPTNSPLLFNADFRGTVDFLAVPLVNGGKGTNYYGSSAGNHYENIFGADFWSIKDVSFGNEVMVLITNNGASAISGIRRPHFWLDAGVEIDSIQLSGLEDYEIAEGTIEARLDNLEVGGGGGDAPSRQWGSQGLSNIQAAVVGELTNQSMRAKDANFTVKNAAGVTLIDADDSSTLLDFPQGFQSASIVMALNDGFAWWDGTSLTSATNLPQVNLTVGSLVVTGALTADRATFTTMVVDSLVSTTRLYSATVFKAMDGTNANTYMQTNRATGNFGLQWTNTTPGQTMLCNVMGEVVGGTDRTITNIVPTGYLVRSNGGALTVGPLLVGLPDGTNIEFSVLHKFENGTNVEDIVVSIQVQ